MSDRQGPAEQADPRQALRPLIERGEGESATATMLRVMWLRQDHPTASVITEPLHLNETTIVVRATIALAEGGQGSGIAASTVEDLSEWAAAVERAETNAIGRALDTLGYLLERAASPQGATAPRPQAPQPQPQAQQPAPVHPQPSQIQPQQSPRSINPPSRPTAVPRADESAPPVINALRRAQRPPAQAGPQPPQPAAEPPRDDDAPLPEYSWTGFWNAARGFGLDAKRVEEILGRPANQSSPKEAVEALRAAGAWGPGDGNE